MGENTFLVDAYGKDDVGVYFRRNGIEERDFGMKNELKDYATATFIGMVGGFFTGLAADIAYEFGKAVASSPTDGLATIVNGLGSVGGAVSALAVATWVWTNTSPKSARARKTLKALFLASTLTMVHVLGDANANVQENAKLAKENAIVLTTEARPKPAAV